MATLSMSGIIHLGNKESGFFSDNGRNGFIGFELECKSCKDEHDLK